MKKLILVLVITIFTSIAVQSQISGAWKGELNIQGTKLPLLFKIKDDNGKL